jgi:hypothetical protein
MIKGAEFSECGKYRYSLWRIWDKSLPYVMCIGLNPSTANESGDDPTIRNLTEMVKAAGYGGLFMVNLFALISSDPNELRSTPDPVKDNDLYIYITACKCQDVIFCWGAFKQADYRARRLFDVYPDALCFGKSASGKPIHPLAASVWMKSKTRLQRFKEVQHG